MSSQMPRSIVRRDRHNQPRKTEDDTQVTQRRASRQPSSQQRPAIQTDEVSTDYEYAADTTDYDDQQIITLAPKGKQKTRPQPPQTKTRSVPLVKQQIAQPKRQLHWLVFVGAGMLVTLVLYIGGFQLWSSARNLYNDWTYGTTRTYHLNAVVGDHDSPASPTHFIAVNLRGTIDVIELPGGDITHAKVYPGPRLLWSQADKAVVTLEVKSVNGDHQQDVVVHVQGNTNMLFQQTTANFVLLNNGAGFKPMAPLQ